MAHFAELNSDNEVIRIIKIDNIKNMTPEGIEDENVGLDYIKNDFGSDGTWKQCSYNTRGGERYNPINNVKEKTGTPFRANYPCPGWIYDTTYGIFHEPRPTDKDGDSCASFILDHTAGNWRPPITKPDDPAKPNDGPQQMYVWDESAYQADNTKGWILV